MSEASAGQREWRTSVAESSAGCAGSRAGPGLAVEGWRVDSRERMRSNE